MSFKVGEKSCGISHERYNMGNIVSGVVMVSYGDGW